MLTSDTFIAEIPKQNYLERKSLEKKQLHTITTYNLNYTKHKYIFPRGFFFTVNSGVTLHSNMEKI